MIEIRVRKWITVNTEFCYVFAYADKLLHPKSWKNEVFVKFLLILQNLKYQSNDLDDQ